jgi:hypothetical protein
MISYQYQQIILNLIVIENLSCPGNKDSTIRATIVVINYMKKKKKKKKEKRTMDNK